MNAKGPLTPTSWIEFLGGSAGDEAFDEACEERSVWVAAAKVQHDASDADDDTSRDLQQLEPNRIDAGRGEVRVLQALASQVFEKHIRR